LLGRSFLEGSRVLFEPLFESRKVSLTFIGDTSLVVFWVPHESWVSSNFNTIGLVGCGIEFGDDEVFVILIGFSEFLPDWSKLLAMSAPWGIVLDKDILGFVKNVFLEFDSNNINNSTLFSWDSSGLKMWLEGSGVNSINESSNGFYGKLFGISFGNIFLHVAWENGSKGWEIFRCDTHEFSELSLDLVGSSSIGEENLTFVGNSSLSIEVHVISLVIIFASEENKGALLLSENGFDLILSECENGWDLEWLDPCLKGVLISSSVVVVLLGLELSEEDKGISGNTEISTARGISMIELDLFLVFGEFDMSLSVESVVKSSEINKGELVRSRLFCDLSASKLSTCWSGLLKDP